MRQNPLPAVVDRSLVSFAVSALPPDTSFYYWLSSDNEQSLESILDERFDDTTRDNETPDRVRGDQLSIEKESHF